MALKIKGLVFRNKYTREGLKAEKNKVNLEYFREAINLGDSLSGVVCEYMLAQKGLSFSTRSREKYSHLIAIGSLLGGRGFFDAVVWGGGVRSFSEAASLGKRKYIQKLDIRAVRGPISRQILQQAGKYTCPEIYGDPAILMPEIYPSCPQKSNKVALVSHFLSCDTIPEENADCIKKIDIKTTDYAQFIDEITKCSKVISSSLHGIILAESYGIPAVFLGKCREIEWLKYYDWYFSTHRTNIRIAHSIKEALEMDPLPLPKLNEMRSNLIASFPYDLWENDKRHTCACNKGTK